MKRLLLILSMVFLLTGCGKNKQISGEVLSIINEGPYVQLILQTEEKQQTRILADGHTFVYSFGGFEEGLLSDKLLCPVVTAYDLRKQDGAWLAERICVDSIQLPENYILSDGTPLTVRKTSNHTTYTAANGTELLRVQDTIGPHNVSVGGIPSFDALDTEAQQNIISYYTEVGLLYDLDEEIEKIHRDFLSMDDPTGFQSRLLSQEICPTAANEKLVWYTVYVTRPVENGLHHQTCTHTVFDRKTGKMIDTADLFACTQQELGKRILEIVGMQDAALSREMEEAFRFEYLDFDSNSLGVCFPAGSLASQNTQHMLGIEYEDLAGFIHPWAIPDSIE